MIDYDADGEFPEDDFPDYSPLTWKDIEPASEAQSKLWEGIINKVFDSLGNKTVNLPYVIGMVCQESHTNIDDYARTALQVERFIRESPLFELHRGKNGGVFRKPSTLIDEE